MGLFLFVLVVVFAVAVGAFGGWLLLNQLLQRDPVVVKAKWKGVEAEGPAGAIIMIVALTAAIMARAPIRAQGRGGEREADSREPAADEGARCAGSVVACREGTRQRP